MALSSAAAALIGTGSQSGMTLSGNIMSAVQARKNREAAINLANTAHQREVTDLRAAGLNPILSAGGGSGAATPNLAMPSFDDAGSGISQAVNTAYANKMQREMTDKNIEKIGQEVKTAASQERVNSALEQKTIADRDVSRKMLDQMDAIAVRELSQAQLNSAAAAVQDELNRQKRFENVKGEKEAKLYEGKHGQALTIGEKIMQILMGVNKLVPPINVPGGR